MTNNSTQHQTNSQNNSYLLSSNPERALNEIIRTIGELHEVYQEENQALGNADTKTFLSLQNRKIEMAQMYDSRMQQLIARRKEFKTSSPALKQKLKQMHEDFSGIAQENLKGIDAMKRSIERLNTRIMNVAKEAAEVQNTFYSAEGALHKRRRSVSMGLNESA